MFVGNDIMIVNTLYDHICIISHMYNNINTFSPLKNIIIIIIHVQ